MNIIQAMEDGRIFGDTFQSETWDTWKILLRSLFGLPMDAHQLAVYQKHTGRQAAPKTQASEAFLVCGRRAGKSNISALVAIFLACFRDYSEQLSAGEVGVVMVIAKDRKQAQVVMGYIKAFFQNPVLKKLVESMVVDAIRLKSGITLEVSTADFKSVRNRTVVCCILDELAFWESSETGQNPDHEILKALRPSMLTIREPLLLGISSPYVQRGVLFEQYQQHWGKDDAPALIWRASTLEMNRTVSRVKLAHALLRDPVAYACEYNAEFRADEAAALILRDIVRARVITGRYELPPTVGQTYKAFIDPSGGSSDSFTLSIAHHEGAKVVIDLIREVQPPFSPEAVTNEFCSDLKRYGITQVTGDNYSGRYAKDPFTKRGIHYELSERNRSELYLNLLPQLNSGTIELLDNDKLTAQLCRLERRTSPLGKDSVDHPSGEHDDVSNAVAGVASLFGGANVVTLSWANMVIEAIGKWGAFWHEHIGEKDDAPIVDAAPVIPEHKNRPENENQSVVQHRSAIIAESTGKACPNCGNVGPTIVRRGASLHCNPCGHGWPTVSPVQAQGGRTQLWKN